MGRIDEQLTEQFYRWEMRGRGWHVYDSPVSAEPPFRPFYGHFLPSAPCQDDGRRPTGLSSFMDWLRLSFAPQPEVAAPETPSEEEPEPDWHGREELRELAVSLPLNLAVPRDAFEQFLFNIAPCRESVSFELLATSEAIVSLFAACPADAPVVGEQLKAYFPEAAVTAEEGLLEAAWGRGSEAVVVEFGLAHEFMVPLQAGKSDMFVGLAGALANLQDGEAGLFQVLFQPVRKAWGKARFAP